MRLIPKPEPGEYPVYASMYMDLMPADARLLAHLAADLSDVDALVRGLPEQRLLHRYAPGKWSVKQVLAHVVDDERIYAYRALRYARGDATALPGFDQDAFAALSAADERPIAEILDELAAVREATIALFRGLPEEALLRVGTGDGQRATVRAMGYHIAGHGRHHVALIRERYLGLSAAAPTTDPDRPR